MKKIYNYDRKTKIFTGTSNLLPDDFGIYNLPAFSTNIEMVEQEGYIAKFNGAAWDYIKKYEYTYIIDNNGFISNNGIEIETDDECPNEIFYKYELNNWVLDLEKAKTYKINSIRQERNSALNALDGLYLGFERDGNSEMVHECELLRNGLKNVPQIAQLHLDGATTIEHIDDVTLKELFPIVPDKIKQYFDGYFDGKY
ncbi:MAG: hypothetical protein Unbinned6284contig1004_6 [Prokaryotic dsDNA virus sp.]|mgnify:CR=1 FL=1|nr:MAG: hypothetical protein Unbinned6284contig1004_6 [Prokaryotic dsDNA virus sp.]|tara:strand:+ start:22821 stop:23417 length:597 start_codon:yes stop_codon:yes gene_type:complete